MFPGTGQRTSTDVPNMCHEQALGAQHYDHSQVHTSSSTRPWHCRMHVMSPLTMGTAKGFLLLAQALCKCTGGSQDTGFNPPNPNGFGFVTWKTSFYT